MERKVIGLLGYAGVGKDEAAKALIERGWRRAAFADKLKDVVRSITGVDPNEDKAAVRPLLVELGRYMRRVDPDYWVRIVEMELDRIDAVDRFLGAESHYVVTDVRYLNEVQMLHNLRGRCVWILRPGVQAANEEERASFDAICASRDYKRIRIIENNGSIGELHEKIIGIAEGAE